MWIYFSNRLDLGPYLFFGEAPGEPLPDLSPFAVAKHAKPNAQGVKTPRPEIRVIPKGQFAKYAGIAELYEVLFGPPDPCCPPSE